MRCFAVNGYRDYTEVIFCFILKHHVVSLTSKAIYGSNVHGVVSESEGCEFVGVVHDVSLCFVVCLDYVYIVSRRLSRVNTQNKLFLKFLSDLLDTTGRLGILVA